MAGRYVTESPVISSGLLWGLFYFVFVSEVTAAAKNEGSVEKRVECKPVTWKTGIASDLKNGQTVVRAAEVFVVSVQLMWWRGSGL